MRVWLAAALLAMAETPGQEMRGRGYEGMKEPAGSWMSAARSSVSPLLSTWASTIWPQSSTASRQFGLTVRAGAVFRDGRPYRGIGVNYFDAFARVLRDPADTSYDSGFSELARRKIPFARFMCCGFWPSDMRLYQSNRSEYFRRLDSVVRSAERHRIGLIPSLFWYMPTIPDLAGEPCDQWGNPNSKSRALMREYVREVVGRYRASPAIWGWEFGNEYSLGEDLPNAAEQRPPVVPSLGTPAKRTARDEVTGNMLRSAYAGFAREVRRYDPYRIILSGNSLPRESAWHNRVEHNWTRDTPEQLREMLAQDNPDPMDTVSGHAYEDYARITGAMKAASGLRKPLILGEFGVKGPPTPETRKQFADMLALIERQRVPVAALWVFDYKDQDADFNVTARNSRSYQLDAVEVANAGIRKRVAGSKR